MSHPPVAQPGGYQAITPHMPFATPQQPQAPPAQYATPRPAPQYQQPLVNQPPAGYKAPQPVEVYTLNDHANASIPADIRDQFQKDDQGRVLFFTAPPINSSRIVVKDGSALGHSAKFLAAKAKRDALIAAKRKAEEASASEREEAAKKLRLESERKLQKSIDEVRTKAFHALENQLALATKTDFDLLVGSENSKAVLTQSLDRLSIVQQQAMEKNKQREERLREEEKARQIQVTGMTVRLEEKI